MILIEPSIELLSDLDGDKILRHIEKATRTCYNSFDKVDEHSHHKLLKKIIDSKHFSVCEHYSVSFKVVCSRATMAQWTRHRHLSFSVQSQRYVCYKHDRHGGNVKFIKPHDYHSITTEKKFVFDETCATMEKMYFQRLSVGFSTEESRGVLGADTATEMIVTGNIRAWAEFLKKRTPKNAQSEIRILSSEILEILRNNIPVIFEEIA